MLRYAITAATLAVFMSSSQSFAITSKVKMETCKFGADDQKLQGAARSKFMKKCMANKDDPRGPPSLLRPLQRPRRRRNISCRHISARACAIVAELGFRLLFDRQTMLIV